MTNPALLVDETVALVRTWLAEAEQCETADDRRATGPLQALIEDPDGVAFAMRFIDRVLRADTNAVAASQLRTLVRERPLPGFLNPVDRQLLRIGGAIAERLPAIVMPLARRRMRQLVGHLIVDQTPGPLNEHLEQQAAAGFAHNVNALGEAVLGSREADLRFETTLALIENPEVTYVSIKLSSVVAQLNHWDFEGSLERVSGRLGVILDRAAASDPVTFVNLDMEEYHDLELTVAAFTKVLGEAHRNHIEAGIVLQAYLPDSFAALRHLVSWANARKASGGADIKIRLVKGANLAMERVEAAGHNWTPAPYDTKAEVDANYKRCLDWFCTPENTEAVRIGVASHNLFDVAWAHLLAEQRGVADRIQIEMLHGMSPAQARVVNDREAPLPLLLYTPIVAPEHFDAAIAYLFRRLEENAAPQNFIRSLFRLRSDQATFASHEDAFRLAVADRFDVLDRPRRLPQRTDNASASNAPSEFVNEPDTDPALAANRAWMAAAVAVDPGSPATPITTEVADIDTIVADASNAQSTWANTAAVDRRELLHRAADALSARRGALISAMVHEANKTVAQADNEVSEAVDFARYYGDRALDLDRVEHASFAAFGTVAVIPPWNFPVAIPAGGALAALAAGNTVILKPAPETPRCAEIVAESLWDAGIDRDVLHFVRTPDDHVGRRLVESVDAVILTGSTETATLFRSWNPGVALFAETSGKNALIITPHADIDLAVADLVASAFGHAGQKCSAASLAICVGDVYESPRFRRQLVDAVESLAVGPAADAATDVNPLIGPASGKLHRALHKLDDGETWLVAPRQLDDNGTLWSPGVRLGVGPGSWFHHTECFGPVLGVMAADDLDKAIDLANSSPFGLTGGIHSLDPTEISRWLDRIEVGNAYVNRGITGAMVQRQPFGGWKGSSVGPGAKAGGPNYVSQLGTWHPTGPLDPEVAQQSDDEWWRREFSQDHDPTGLAHEANIFRYRALPATAIRVAADGSPADLARVQRAAARAGVAVTISMELDLPGQPEAVQPETAQEFVGRLPHMGVERIRVIGTPSPELREAAATAGVHLATDPVTANGYLEIRHFMREQAVSQTLHRFGNIVGG